MFCRPAGKIPVVSRFSGVGGLDLATSRPLPQVSIHRVAMWLFVSMLVIQTWIPLKYAAAVLQLQSKRFFKESMAIERQQQTEMKPASDFRLPFLP